MKKILLPVLFALFVSACTPTTQTGTPDGGTTSQKDTKPAYITELEATPQELRDAPTFQACIVSSVASCSQYTAGEIARTTDDVGICDKLTTDDAKGGCKYGVVLPKAIAAKDVSLCDALSGSNYHTSCRTQIIAQVAQEKGDIRECQQISNTLSGGQAEDDLTAKTETDQCIMSVITSRITPDTKTSDCDSISSEALRINCAYMIESQQEIFKKMPETLPAPQPVETPPSAPPLSLSGDLIVPTPDMQ